MTTGNTARGRDVGIVGRATAALILVLGILLLIATPRMQADEVFGRISGPPPAPSQLITFYTKDGFFAAQVPVGQDGRYSVNLSEGFYRAEIFTPGQKWEAWVQGFRVRTQFDIYFQPVRVPRY